MQTNPPSCVQGHVDIEQPFDDKQWAFDAANLTQGEC